jgi:hypothetical protein
MYDEPRVYEKFSIECDFAYIYPKVLSFPTPGGTHPKEQARAGHLGEAWRDREELKSEGGVGRRNGRRVGSMIGNWHILAL